MLGHVRYGIRGTVGLALLLLTAPGLPSAEPAKPVETGLRVFTCGHSFHIFVPPILDDLARKAGIKGHQIAGRSGIGGSQVIRHWEVPGDRFKSKEMLSKGEVDVLTLSPIHLPDAGIEKFATLAVKHNPNIRITVQEFWLPFDLYDPTFTRRPKLVDHDAPTIAELRKMHEPYFKSIDDHVKELNGRFKKDVLFVVPVGQAVIALREKILAGEAPGLAKQSDLFTDAIGHARAPLMTLNAYCHFAVIYRRSPVGLPVPAVLARPGGEKVEKLNRLLQELAWDAVTRHPLSGVSASKRPAGE